MKVVCCKNCGAKYQLDDDDDITTFECSSLHSLTHSNMIIHILSNAKTVD